MQHKEIPSGLGALGISFMVYGLLVIFGTLLSIVVNLLTDRSGAGYDASPSFAQGEQIGYYIGTGCGGLVGFIIAGLCIVGGLKMKSATGHTMAVAAAVAAMLPCTGCCLFGFPLGIWALVVLLKPETKALFAQPV